MAKEVIARDVNYAHRAALAVQLRAQHLTYDEIARRVGLSNASAARKAILRELNRVIVRNVDELRREELSMLDQLHAEIWPLAMDRKNRWRLSAVDRLLAISERRCKLMGLDMPTDQAIAANMVVIREVPAGYLGDVQG